MVLRSFYIKCAIIVLLLLTLVVSVGLYAAHNREQVANMVWDYTKADGLALWINNDTSPLLPIRMGEYYFGGGREYDIEKAEEAYRLALSINPSVTWAHYQLGRVHFINGDFVDAIQELRTELDLYSEHKRTHYILGLVYGYIFRETKVTEYAEQAEEQFALFVEATPEEWAGYNDLAWIQLQLGKYEEARNTALRAFHTISWKVEELPWLWTTLGVANLNMRNYNESRDALLKARSISEGMTAEYFWSAYPGNDFQNADAAFDQFKATISFNLGIVYEALGEHQLAIDEYEQYLTMLPIGPFPGREEIENKIEELSSYEG